MNATGRICIWIFLLAGHCLMGAPLTSPYGELSPEEARVIADKGTEAPFSGRYEHTTEPGLYACRRCGAPLYNADDKFDAHCGWPAFDDALPGAVKRTPDPDGKRTEISCRRCGAHLGHVFAGEKLTGKDMRYCVNSVSLVFEPQSSPRLRRAVFAGGCFWGVEELFRNQPGVIAAISGYTGGKTPFPTYPMVCTGRTGHAEAVEVIYDPSRTDYEKLCRYFLEIHDPTQRDRQGPDHGTQYRSAIFPFDAEQRATAEKLLQILRGKGYDVATRIEPFTRFWIAEPYHQSYYEKTGKAPYCHGYQKRF